MHKSMYPVHTGNQNITYNLLSFVRNIPAVQMWQDEWGAQEIPFTDFRWLWRRATGELGARISIMIVWKTEREREKAFIENNVNLAQTLCQPASC